MNQKTVMTSVERRHELLAGVAECAAVYLKKKFKMSDDEVADIGNWLADFLAEHWRGQTVYFPSDYKYKNSKRDEEICARMERGNAHELAHEYGLSYVRIYEIYRRHLEKKHLDAKSETTTSTSQAEGSPPKAAVKRTKEQGIQAHNVFGPRGIF